MLTPSYDASKRTEILGLFEKGMFKPYPRSEILRGTRLFNGRFINKIKYAGTV